MSARIIILIERTKDFDQKFIHKKCFSWILAAMHLLVHINIRKFLLHEKLFSGFSLENFISEHT